MREHSSMPFQLKGFVIDISRPRFGKGKVVEIAKNKIQIEFFILGPYHFFIEGFSVPIVSQEE